MERRMESQNKQTRQRRQRRRRTGTYRSSMYPLPPKSLQWLTLIWMLLGRSSLRSIMADDDPPKEGWTSDPSPMLVLSEYRTLAKSRGSDAGRPPLPGWRSKPWWWPLNKGLPLPLLTSPRSDWNGLGGEVDDTDGSSINADDADADR